MAKLKVAGITRESVTDGPGLRLVVYTQGCPHRCDGCHNPETWDVSGGYELESELIFEQIKENPLLAGLTISGGEPFLQAKNLIDLVQKTSVLGKNTVIYTGYTFEELMQIGQHQPEILELLKAADYLVDGPFIKELKTFTLPFRGSSNQRFIDLKKSFLQKQIVEVKWE
ncbi:anaerobic ribonucleoside-triphosphate reductase activating protein [Carboxydothermus ferrireducens]|uniref:Anaerobic ribonucleoside-triphosphate reductase-activating protein n=1 Tax=Carboxydothermus ferrireducens DSM 11255 TaxID=1119529 RepID=A0ABX2RG11_9THEO|nr:anaerobic ribonucleoside-triphosphate reductase activating protein [Carboxydothermus ferrireducens]NYE58763.1 anaerobic ribonucleoside-triphosphate reductase activating protein [Carboxydothermus ferrireducens DSM 11255]